MTRQFSVLAFATGLLVIASMANSVVAGDTLTLLVMLFITAAYIVGGWELFVFQRDTRGLQCAMANLPPFIDRAESDVGGSDPCDQETLAAWLGKVPGTLRQSVQQRITGEYVGLPAPVLTPYLVGLLVMLGLMGTFVGMVATLGGAVQALEGGTELSAIREGLAAPIQGLGMAFGTSVAGVAASAMLGLIATLSRRERLSASRALEQLRDNHFKRFSLIHHRQETYRALQQQAMALPAVANSLVELTERLGKLGEQLEQSSERSASQLLSQQQTFESGVRDDFSALTASVAEKLEASLTSVGKQAAETLQPQIQKFLAQGSEQLVNAAKSNTDALKDLHNKLLVQLSESRDEQAQQASEWQTILNERAQALITAFNDQQTIQLAHQAEQEEARQQAEQRWLDAMSARSDSMVKALSVLQDQFLAQQSREIETRQATEASWKQSIAEQSALILQGWSELREQLTVLESEQQQSRREAEQQWQRVIQENTQALIAALAEHQQSLIAKLDSQDESRRTSDEAWQASSIERSRQLVDELASHLETLKGIELRRTEAVANQLSELSDNLETQLIATHSALGASFDKLRDGVGQQLTELTTGLQASIEDLVASTSEAPKAAAELVAQLQVDTQRNLERDNELLSERTALMKELSLLSEELRANTALQQQVMEQVLEKSGNDLLELSTRVGEQLGQCGEQIAGTALELSELGSGFSEAVTTFKVSNEDMQKALVDISTALAGAGERSNEQLAYYVAQAREIIDHNLLTQQVILEKLEAATGGARA